MRIIIHGSGRHIDQIRDIELDFTSQRLFSFLNFLQLGNQTKETMNGTWIQDP